MTRNPPRHPSPLAAAYDHLRRLHVFWKFALALLLLAVVLQVANKSPTDFVYFRVGGIADDTVPYREDPELFWKPLDDFRAQDNLAARTPAAQRIFFFGGSVAYGFAAERSYPALLGDRLAADPRTAARRVINYAYPGYTSHQAARLARRVLAKFPGRLLCVAVGTNDYRPVNFSDRQVEEINRGAAKRALAVLNRVRIFALYRHALLRLGKRPTGVEEQWRGGAPRVSLAEFRDNLRRFVELARAGRIPLALISEESEAASLRAKLDPYWRIMADLAAQNANVTYLDVRAYLRRFAVAGPDGPTYPRAPAQAIFVDFCHLTARGNQLVAEFLAEQLQARGLL